MNVKAYRKKGHTKFIKEGFKGLLTLHDSGRLAISCDHKPPFYGLSYEEEGSYYVIVTPTTTRREFIMNRLFDYND